jgi:hypothetical protein
MADLGKLRLSGDTLYQKRKFSELRIYLQLRNSCYNLSMLNPCIIINHTLTSF